MSLMTAVNAMAENYNMPILYSCHPRSKKYIEARGFKFDERVIQHKPLGFFDYNKLQQNAFCVVSDSGTIAISIPFSTIASIVRNQDMIPNGHDRYYSYSIIAGAIVNLIVNYLLIPKYQAIGVTIGTIIAEIIVCICELWLVRGTNHYAKMLAQPFAYFIPSVVMFYVVRLLGKVLGLHVYTLVIQVTAGVLAFCFASFLVLLIIKDKDAKRAVELIRSKITNRSEK